MNQLMDESQLNQSECKEVVFKENQEEADEQNLDSETKSNKINNAKQE